jgi:hypothetical protein
LKEYFCATYFAEFSMYGNTVLSLMFSRSSCFRIAALFDTDIRVTPISGVPFSSSTASNPNRRKAPDCDEILSLLRFPLTQMTVRKCSRLMRASKNDFSSLMKWISR